MHPSRWPTAGGSCPAVPSPSSIAGRSLHSTCSGSSEGGGGGRPLELATIAEGSPCCSVRAAAEPGVQMCMPQQGAWLGACTAGQRANSSQNQCQGWRKEANARRQLASTARGAGASRACVCVHAWRPASLQEITKRIHASGLRGTNHSATPESSVGGALSRDPAFTRVGKDLYALQVRWAGAGGRGPGLERPVPAAAGPGT